MQTVLQATDRIFYQSARLEISSAVARAEHYPAHAHAAQFQLEMVLRGATECGIGRQRFPVQQQYCSVVNPDIEHYNVTRRWKHALFVIFPRHILDETAWQVYRLLSQPVAFAQVVAPCSPGLVSAVQMLYHEALQRHEAGRRLVFETGLVQLSVMLLRHLQGNHSGRAMAAPGARAVQPRIARAVDLIHSEFRDDLGLDDLAGAAAMSRYHFLRCFKAELGMTPYAYVQHVRLQAAAELLRASSRTVMDIALSCGFTSPGRFSAAFRRRYRSTPSAYRRMYRR